MFLTPGDRRFRAFGFENVVEGLRLWCFRAFDDHVKFEGLQQSLPHAHYIVAAIDGLLGQRDGELIDCEIWGVTAEEWRARWAEDEG